ncbi:MAG: sulfatase [Phycisphaeraceae bacterium]|nr:sulfatase [Phycisphaeraceae bacterium]
MALPSPEAATAPIKPQPMNVLFIATDDLNDEVACLGSTVAKTPNIDKLAASGMLFRHAYTQQALCNPSRASLFTGLRPDTLKVWDLKTHFRDTHPDVVTLPQLFMQHGYFTQGIGKLYHNWRQETHGDPQSWSVPQMYHFAPHFSDWYIPGTPQGTPAEKPGPATQCEDVPDETYFDGRIAQEAIKALNQLKQTNQPFFLAVGFWKPHLPFNAPKQYWDMYDPEAIPGPDPATAPRNVPEIALHNYKELRGYTDMPQEGPPTPQQVKHLRHGYFAAISYVDAQIGKVLDELDKLGLADNTIVVFWSDHGYHIGEHAIWSKTSNFERDAQVPLIISVPGMANAGQQCDALVELLDLYPTVADLAGLAAPHPLEGKSLRPVLENPTVEVREAALTQHPRPPYGEKAQVMGYSIRTQGYRYTEWRAIDSGDLVARELYDHQQDDIESVNIVDEPALVEQVQQLHELLQQTIDRGH